MALATHISTQAHPASLRPAAGRARGLALRMLPAILAPALAALAGCGGAVTANPAQTAFSLSPGMASIDTNCTGCNAADAHGLPVHQFAATLTGGGAAAVTWSLSGGDASAGPGTISATGQYTPPSYLTADQVQVTVTAALNANPSIKATSVLTLTPGFLRPLTPENLALGANGTATITGYLAQAGGGASIYFALADTATGSSGGQGSLSAPHCERSGRAFTACTVTYTAPAVVPTTGVTYVVATAGNSPAKTEAAILLNAAGVASNPASHGADGYTHAAGQLRGQQRRL